MVSYVDIIGLCHRDIYVMRLPFQAHVNYGTWSLDFGMNVLIIVNGPFKFLDLECF